jgi:hypothetical protein
MTSIFFVRILVFLVFSSICSFFFVFFSGFLCSFWVAVLCELIQDSFS